MMSTDVENKIRWKLGTWVTKKGERFLVEERSSCCQVNIIISDELTISPLLKDGPLTILELKYPQ